MRRFLLSLALVVSVFAPLTLLPTQTNAANCRYVLGFKAIHDAIPDMVGDCLDNEAYAANGDALQHTTAWHGKGGLLAWRKTDNWTAFTDGYRTWVNGPVGIQERLNTERFPWENDRPLVAIPTPRPTPTSVPPPTVWAAIAFDLRTGAWGASWDYPDMSGAQGRAMAQCGSNCVIVSSFNDGYTALARGAWGGGWSYNASKDSAISIALMECNTQFLSCSLTIVLSPRGPA